MIKRFQLGGKKYKVNLVSHDTSNLGRSLSPLGIVEIQTLWDGKPVPEDAMEITLYHEVVHCILDELGRGDLQDEGLVQQLALLFHQFIKTQR